MYINGCLDYIELADTFPRAVKAEYFAKRSEKRKTLDNVKEKEVENLEEDDCPEAQDHTETDEEM